MSAVPSNELLWWTTAIENGTPRDYVDAYIFTLQPFVDAHDRSTCSASGTGEQPSDDSCFLDAVAQVLFLKPFTQDQMDADLAELNAGDSKVSVVQEILDSQQELDQMADNLYFNVFRRTATSAEKAQFETTFPSTYGYSWTKATAVLEMGKQGFGVPAGSS